MSRHFCTTLFLFLSALNVFSQDVGYAQRMIDTLSSEYFFGRGYVNSGDQKAADFIANEFADIGVDAMDKGRFHEFSFPVNTFPGHMHLNIDGTELYTGLDYVVDPASKGINKSDIRVKHINENALINDNSYKKLLKSKHRGFVVMVDTVSSDSTAKARRSYFIENFQGHCLILVENDLTWSVSRSQSDIVKFKVKPGWTAAKRVSIAVDAKFIAKYSARNVLGIIPGSEVPDSFVILTGHYDHLGGMGSDVYIPGANDNASGIAMILDMARYFEKNPPRYSMVFIGFAAEEAGLVGSYFLVQELNKYFPDITKIRFLLNMDLMGSGEDGIMAVNGKVFTKEYEVLDSINSANTFLKEVRSRGKSANSDHYFFSEAGIPSFFVYLMGEYAFYHEVDDSSKNLRLNPNSYNGSFLLLRTFLEHMMQE